VAGLRAGRSRPAPSALGVLRGSAGRKGCRILSRLVLARRKICCLVLVGAVTALGLVGSCAAVDSAALVPYCPGSEQALTHTQTDCLFRPWAFPKQAATFDGTATLTKPPTRVGTTWNYRFTVTVHYTVPYKRCAGSTADFPCRQPALDESGKPVVSFEIIGAYVPGAKALEGVSPLGVAAQGCADGSGTCTETFQLNTYSIWGHFVFVVRMNVGYYVPLAWGGAGGIDGGAGFDTAFATTFPKLKGSSAVEVTPA
jgi:hypothetical protein